MGTAVLQGLLRSDNGDFKEINACVRTAASERRLKQDLSNHAKPVTIRQGDIVQASSIADVVILGCKSEDLEEMLSSGHIVQQCENKLVISLMAGVSPAKLKAVFESHNDGCKFDIVEAIPSIGAKLGESMTLVTGAEAISEKHKTYLDAILSSVGTTSHIQQTLMDDAVAVGAVTHAITILTIDALTDAGVAKGLPRAMVADLAAKNLRSASGLLDAGMSPELLKAAMSTPSGITLNSMLRLESGGARSAVQNAAVFAIDYARQMCTK